MRMIYLLLLLLMLTLHTVTLSASANFDPHGEIISDAWTLDSTEIATGIIA